MDPARMGQGEEREAEGRRRDIISRLAGDVPALRTCETIRDG